MIANAIAHTVDAHLSMPGIEVEVQTFRQPEPFQGIVTAETHTLSMSLTPQVQYSRSCYLDADGQLGIWSQVGDIAFAPQGSRLMVVAPGGAECYRAIYCAFSATLFEQMTGFANDWTASELAATLNVRAPLIKRDLYRILKEISEEGAGREYVIEAIAKVVLVELARHLRHASPLAQPAGAGLAGWQMRRITDYIDGLVDHCPSVEELARLCDIGPRHLSRAFKASTGQTIGEYVNKVRMIKAKSLLTDTDLSQKEIAFRLGFSGPSSFCVAFGKAVGVTPKQYRSKNHRE